ncbi:hypothetical protein ACN47E_000494 [Coniothyrium glycines]
MSTATTSAQVALPRVAITYCTQCKWMLRAAYFGQELLSTFGTQIGEIALIPATGGLFTVELTYIPASTTSNENNFEVQKVLLWDRKAEGGFPETKVLKQRVRDCIDPKKDLGHSDVGGKKKAATGEGDKAGASVQPPSETTTESNAEAASVGEIKRNPDGSICDDCR